MLEGLFGLFDNRVLGVLVALEIPDRLDRPRAVDDLAAEIGCARDPLERVLRYAAGRGYIRIDRRGRVRPTAVSDVLRRDHPASWRGWVEFAGSDWFWSAWQHLDAGLRSGRPPMVEATGHDFFEYVNTVRPDGGHAFNRAMEAGATVQALALDRALDWSGEIRACDVGGGTGAALAYLLARHHRLRGVLFDLPEVVGHARPDLRTGELAARCEIEAGSFFEAVPAGADRYLLLAIVHDWDDESATRLLANVAAAMGPASRAFVVEGVLADRPRDDFVQASDLLMCVLATGRERTRTQLDALFTAAGLGVERTHPLATGFTAFELART